MKNYILILFASVLLLNISYSQNLRFSYKVQNPDPANNQSKVIVYVQNTGGGTENLASFSYGFYYKSSEATILGFGAGATSGGFTAGQMTTAIDLSYATGLGWVTANATGAIVTVPPVPPVGVPIGGGYDRKFIGNLIDDAVVPFVSGGSDIGSTPIPIVAVTFDNTIGGAPISTDSVYQGASDTDPAWRYSNIFFGENLIQTVGNRLQTLPIQLISFKAEKYQELSSHLTWSTFSEINSSHFNIQRSFDKKTWAIIGKVDAAGNSQMIENYEFIDSDVYNGRDTKLSAYYRLEMVDLDGQTKLSPIESVIFGKISTSGREFVVYPNPASDGLQVEWDANSVDQPTTLEFFDIQGKLVYSRKVSENTNQEYIDFGQTTIQPGLYLLRILNGAEPLDHQQIIVGNR